MDVLMQAQHKASEALYKQQTQAQANPQSADAGSEASTGSSSPPKPEGDVIDAEVVEDEKK